MRSVENASKLSINLSLNAKVVDMAREMGLDIAQIVDTLLTREVLRQHLARWPEDNADAINAYNTRIAQEGTLAERIRNQARLGPDT